MMRPSVVHAPRRARLLLVLALAAVPALACHIEEPFARENHWDSGGTAKKTLTGPDSTFSIGDRIAVTLEADPPLPPGPLQIDWISNGVSDTATQVLSSGYAEFVVAKAHAGYQPVAVAAKFDGVLVAWTVWVGQRVAAIDLFCGTAAAPVACDAAPVSFGTTLTINSTMADANGNAIRRRNEAMKRAVTVVRDPAVLSAALTTPNTAGSWSVRAVGVGSTWLVVTTDRGTDSVRVVVAP